MKSFAFSPRTLFESGRHNSLYEAVWAYVFMVGCITLLSVITGVLFTFVIDAPSAIMAMRLVNGAVAFFITWHLIKHKNMNKRLVIIAIIAGMLSASGYEIIGFILPAALTMHQATTEHVTPE